MKKIFGYIIAAFACVATVGCNDDIDNPYASVNSISIVDSHVAFSAPADKGSVKFSCAGNVSVTSNRDWCKAIVDGDSVIVTVTNNESLDGRAANVTLRNGADTVQVAVVQNGIKINLGTQCAGFDNDYQQSMFFSLTSDLPISITSTPDWVSAQISDSLLHVEVTENTTGHLRTGYIHYGVGEFQDSLRVFQADFDTDIAGSYTFYYLNEDLKADSLKRKTLSKTGLSLKNKGNVCIPMTYDPDNGAMVITTGTFAGTDNDYSLYTIFMLGEELWTGYNAGAKISIPFEYNDKDGTVLRIKGYVSGESVSAISLRHFSGSFDQSSDVGTVYKTYNNPVIKRAPESTASQVSSYVLR